MENDWVKPLSFRNLYFHKFDRFFLSVEDTRERGLSVFLLPYYPNFSERCGVTSRFNQEDGNYQFIYDIPNERALKSLLGVTSFFEISSEVLRPGLRRRAVNLLREFSEVKVVYS
ncbi:MAG: hypothetical protein AABY10_06235 [Nanoarchaeota archaeon]